MQELKIPTNGEKRGEREIKPNPTQCKNIDSDLREHDYFITGDQPGLVLTEKRLNTAE
jgi:hypothetical protein